MFRCYPNLHVMPSAWACFVYRFVLIWIFKFITLWIIKRRLIGFYGIWVDLHFRTPPLTPNASLKSSGLAEKAFMKMPAITSVINGLLSLMFRVCRFLMMLFKRKRRQQFCENGQFCVGTVLNLWRINTKILCLRALLLHISFVWVAPDSCQ